MGASGWSYSVPYQEDIADALEKLRDDVYARGEHYKQDPDPTRDMTEDEYRATLDLANDPDGIQQFLLEEWQQARLRPIPVDADTLIAAQPESGTHSIIDICNGLSEDPDYFTAAPLTADQTLDLFGTARPSTPQVLHWLTTYDIGKIRDRWEGAYLISYSPDGKPEQIHFTGYSGD